VAIVCAECGATFESNRENARFCSGAHQIEFANRMAKRGKIVMPYLMAWIEGRGGGNSAVHPVAGKAMRELTSIVRDFLEEDRKPCDERPNGRPPATDYAESLFASGFLYCDRKRVKRRRTASDQ
jgi:hypothetical protein